MEILNPYDVHAFNQLSGLQVSNDILTANNGTEVLATSIRDLFANHPLMAKTYGVILLHRHFELKANEVLVDVNGCSTAWTLPSPAASLDSGIVFEKYGGFIRPRSWLVSGGKLRPYEFFFDNAVDKSKQRFASESPHFELAFVKQFISMLAANGLDSVLGLYLLSEAEENLVEVTEGFANVTFPNTGNIPDPLVSTTWHYGLESPVEMENGSKPPITQWACWPGTSCIINGRDGHIKVARRELYTGKLIAIVC